MKRYIVIALLTAILIGLLAFCPVLPVNAQSATATYTPIPTRTQTAATQSVIVVQTINGGTATFSPSMTAGDAFVVASIAAVFALIGLYWAYAWVKSHIRTQEQG
jgi:uncharacterized membrane protein YdjX (TVP38/TMEM64 family)